MTTAFENKSIFIHNVYNVLGGDYLAIAAWLHDKGFTAVLPKTVDGFIEYTYVDNKGIRKPNVPQEFVDVMHLHGIKVIGWAFNYGYDGDKEGTIAAQVCDRLGLDGFVFDMESRLENFTDSEARAGKVIGTFIKKIGKRVPLAFCSWAFYWNRVSGSQIHEPETAKLMMQYCDYIMPMIYWNRVLSSGPQQMSNAEVLSYIKDSVAMQQRITSKPIVPALRAYTGDGGFANPDNILAAGVYARGSFPGASWWFMDHASDEKHFPGVADALKLVPDWGAVTNPEPEPEKTLEQRVTDIEARLKRANIP